MTDIGVVTGNSILRNSQHIEFLNAMDNIPGIGNIIFSTNLQIVTDGEGIRYMVCHSRDTPFISVISQFPDGRLATYRTTLTGIPEKIAAVSTLDGETLLLLTYYYDAVGHYTAILISPTGNVPDKQLTNSQAINRTFHLGNVWSRVQNVTSPGAVTFAIEYLPNTLSSSNTLISTITFGVEMTPDGKREIKTSDFDIPHPPNVSELQIAIKLPFGGQLCGGGDDMSGKLALLGDEKIIFFELCPTVRDRYQSITVDMKRPKPKNGYYRHTRVFELSRTGPEQWFKLAVLGIGSIQFIGTNYQYGEEISLTLLGHLKTPNVADIVMQYNSYTVNVVDYDLSNMDVKNIISAGHYWVLQFQRMLIIWRDLQQISTLTCSEFHYIEDVKYTSRGRLSVTTYTIATLQYFLSEYQIDA